MRLFAAFPSDPPQIPNLCSMVPTSSPKYAIFPSSSDHATASARQLMLKLRGSSEKRVIEPNQWSLCSYKRFIATLSPGNNGGGTEI
jgi:hypothetical protein